MPAQIETLTWYPVKGLSGETLANVTLQAGDGVPFDRMFGFARPGSGFDPKNPHPLPKTKFYMLARDARLAQLSTAYDTETGLFRMAGADQTGMFDLRTEAGKDDA